MLKQLIIVKPQLVICRQLDREIAEREDEALKTNIEKRVTKDFDTDLKHNMCNNTLKY